MERADPSTFGTHVLLAGIVAWFSFVLWYVYIRRDTSSSLPPKPSTQQKTLLLDLDETLVHSTVKRPLKFHYRLSVTLAKNPTEFYVIKRPNVDKFLKQVCKWYQVYIFTAGVRDYAEPLLKRLDPNNMIHGRFFRDSCTLRRDQSGFDFYVKEFSRIGMDPANTIIIDNQPISYCLNKDSAIPIAHFFDDMSDDALMDLLPWLDVLRHVADVRSVLGLRVERR